MEPICSSYCITGGIYLFQGRAYSPHPPPPSTVVNRSLGNTPSHRSKMNFPSTHPPPKSVRHIHTDIQHTDPVHHTDVTVYVSH